MKMRLAAYRYEWQMDAMRIWRLTRATHQALDGQGALMLGGRYSSAGRPIVSFASEAGLVVLVALRYLQADPERNAADYVLGWTEMTERPSRVPAGFSDDRIKDFVDNWAASQHSLFMAIPSAVLPEADIILMNASHPEAKDVPALTSRPFSFQQCLHRPPMLDLYRSREA